MTDHTVLTARKPLLLMVLSLLIAGCAANPIRPVSDATDSATADRALVAFSAVQSETFKLRDIELVVPGASTDEASVTRVGVPVENDGPVLFLYEISADQARFGSLRFIIGDGWWETGAPGPEISIVPGSLTYLGQLQPMAIRLLRLENPDRNYPTAVKVDVVDAGEQDIPQIRSRFRVPAAMPVINAVPGAWGEAEFASLVFHPIPGRRGRFDYTEDAKFSGPVGPDLPAPSRRNP